jgi:hypothetical protein
MAKPSGIPESANEAEGTKAVFRFEWRINFLGGELCGTGDTPQNALTAARQAWLNEVAQEFNDGVRL